MKYIIHIIIGLLGFSSCGDFLKEQSEELVYASSCSDLDEIMIGNVYMKSRGNLGSASSPNDLYYPFLFVIDDDITEYVTGEYNEWAPCISFRPFYTWQQEPFFSSRTNDILEDENWEKLYKHISFANLVISQVKEFKHDPEEMRRRITGEALFLRAAYYYLLVNIYAKPYSSVSAQNDLGLPLKLTEYVEDKYYSRNSVQEVYDQIVNDLKAAADNLKEIQQPSIYRVNETAARILLSRIYLYMGEWQLALDESRKAIEIGCPLWDVNTFTFGEEDIYGYWTKKQYVNSIESPELLFTQGYNTMQGFTSDSWTAGSGRYRVSDELIDLLTKYEQKGLSDLRLKGYLMQSTTNNSFYHSAKTPERVDAATAFDEFVIRSAEAYLNKAEAEAMLDKADAKETIKTLLINRFENGNIPDISRLSGEELVKFIREERRRELCFECHRWFDLRRYAVSPKYPESKEIIHPIYTPEQTSDGSFRLKRYQEETAYVFQIPGYEIEFNKGEMLKNEEREVRKNMLETSN